MTNRAKVEGRDVGRALLVLPSLIFVAVNILKFELGVDGPYNLLRPVIGAQGGLTEILVSAVVILGPLAAVAITFRRSVSFSVRRADSGVDARATFNARWVDLVILAMAAATLVAIGLYLIAENL